MLLFKKITEQPNETEHNVLGFSPFQMHLR
jgi:hypothetical protein